MPWTTVPLSDRDQDSPITQPLIGALYDNPIAIANGDVGAPRIQAIAAMSHQGLGNTVGMPVFARRLTAGDIGFNGGVGGADLVPTSAVTGISVSSSPTGGPTLAAGSALNGTYRCLGLYDHAADSSGVSVAGATLWIRIA
jgi:hypothetical protein